jgi:hypothetical protein
MPKSMMMMKMKMPLPAEPDLKKKAISKRPGQKARPTNKAPSEPATTLDELAEDANKHKVCAEKNYRSLHRRQAKASRQGGGIDSEVPADSSALLPSVEDIVELVQRYPTTNECTHFAAVLDLLSGRIAWYRYRLEPIDEGWN